MGALARPVGEADQLLLAFGRRANDGAEQAEDDLLLAGLPVPNRPSWQ